jgi:hypothetical protein
MAIALSFYAVKTTTASRLVMSLSWSLLRPTVFTATLHRIGRDNMPRRTHRSFEPHQLCTFNAATIVPCLESKTSYEESCWKKFDYQAGTILPHLLGRFRQCKT